ncbi:tRNA-uridine aminocarboxypropyltransferase [Marchantia polymorpha subsp. ruderalis]|nr:hypothetical protein MARPO_0023s0152 [Marchantia polymorpha]BBN01995.1 hypothetical protein Mp_2g11870 [Marchantia polymorpha subsp. ruderalis]|eukprot:PTQ43857.1 hypothetical protein MARPO_0023s0152 [Marchantia polymorpha]
MRETCVSCGRPHRVCLCSVLPKHPLRTATKIIILQHPHETRHKLATVPVAARCLLDCEVVVGRKFRPGSCHHLDECASSSSAECRTCGHKNSVLLLFPTPTATDLRAWCQSSKNATRSSASESLDIGNPHVDGDELTEGESLHSLAERALELGGEGQGLAHEEVRDGSCGDGCRGRQRTLLIVDGTWQHAKEMVKASAPFLEDFVTNVSLPHDVSREGWGMGDMDSILRKEPFAGCVSTMEAIARALGILELDGPRIETTLLSVLQEMVNLQASHFSPLKPRPRLAKKKFCDGQADGQPA